MATRRIVLGVDGSECGAHAMAWAADLAAELDAEVIAVHAFDLLATLGSRAAAQAVPEDKTLLNAAREDFESEWIAPLREAGVNFRTEIREGNPAQVLLDIADASDADMIVIGARGLGGLKEVLLGSVSNHISHHADVPVVIIRQPKR